MIRDVKAVLVGFAVLFVSSWEDDLYSLYLLGHNGSICIASTRDTVCLNESNAVVSI